MNNFTVILRLRSINNITNYKVDKLSNPEKCTSGVLLSIYIIFHQSDQSRATNHPLNALHEDSRLELIGIYPSLQCLLRLLT